MEQYSPYDEERLYLKKWPFWCVSHFRRFTNSPAHNLAQWATVNGSFGYLPPEVIPPEIFSHKEGTSAVNL